MSEMNFPQLAVHDYGRGAYLVTTAEKPIPLRSVAYVGDESTQILNADDGETARRFAYLFAAAPKLLEALKMAERVIRHAAQESTGRVKAEVVGGWIYHADQTRAAIAAAEIV